MLSALIINDVPVECINRAAIEYYVPATLIISVLKAENGRVGESNRNTNGTYDLGPMQINSSWLPTLKRYGYTQYDVQFNACKNVEVGAWILAQAITGHRSWWPGVGDYHSHTYDYNLQYQSKVKYYFNQMNNFLQDHENTNPPSKGLK